MEIRNILRYIFSVLLSVCGFGVHAEVVSMGTGVVMNDAGKIVVNAGVLKGAQDLLVYGLGETLLEVYRAKVVRVDSTSGMAILQVNKNIEVKYKVADIVAGDTINVVYDVFLMFRNEVETTTAVVEQDSTKRYKIKHDDGVALVGAVVINKQNAILGFVADSDYIVSPKTITEMTIVGDPVVATSPKVCAVVAHDEVVNIEVGGTTDFKTTEQNAEVKRDNLLEMLGLEMVEVAGGTYMMGCSGGYADCTSSEKPAHEIKVDSFKIGKYEVTQRQWMIVMQDNPSPIVGDDLPVFNVSYDDAQEFIRRINDAHGTHFRLPTEAEWEFAAKGGIKSKSYKYAGSNNLAEVAWYRDNANAKPHKVGTKKANELGIYDMCGNVSEWCEDDYKSYSAPDYKPYYYSRFELINVPDTVKVATRDSFVIYKIDESEKLKNKLIEDRKVMRGSGYFYEKARCNVSYRRACKRTDKYTFGFRLAE